MTIETANRLLELRKQHNLSQEELAEKLGVSRQAVSKWERSEASPDTDNLIALAKIYGLSLDELVFGKSTNDESSTEEAKSESDDDTTKVKIGPTGIYVESDDGDKVKIDLSGIKIISSGSKNEDDDDDEDYVEDEDVTIIDADNVIIKGKKKKPNFWLSVPYPIICALAYLLFGFSDICGGWALSWIIFVTIPIYYSLVEAICKKSIKKFEYPIFIVLVYLYIGLYLGNWHPSWVIFLTIPLYESIIALIEKLIKKRKKAKEKVEM